MSTLRKEHISQTAGIYDLKALAHPTWADSKEFFGSKPAYLHTHIFWRLFNNVHPARAGRILRHAVECHGKSMSAEP